MTIIEKMYAGEELSEEELHRLATGYSRYCDTEPGEYEEIDLVEGDCNRWTQDMEPENIGALQEELNQYKKLGDLDRLREIVQADRERRCVVLPCKLHDKVFFIENGCVKETEVDSFHNWTSGRWKISTHTDRMYEHWKGYEIDFSGIGKTVFLSREDAEKAVEMEENRNG